MLASLVSHDRIRVLTLRQKQKARLAPVFHGRQGALECSECRPAPGLVTVEAENDLRHMSKQAFKVRLAGGRAQCGHGIGNAKLGQRDYVHVAFYNDNTVETALCFAGLIEAIELSGFLKHRGFRGIEILGLIIPKHPTSEGDNPASGIQDGKHDAVTEAVVDAVFIVFNQHAACH